MKAIMLKDIADETRNYKKGDILDVTFNPYKTEDAVYCTYIKDNKEYKHWFNIFGLDENRADVKIIDTEGYDLEKAIDIIISENDKMLENIVNELREVFKG